jgi:hypothetical protein
MVLVLDNTLAALAEAIQLHTIDDAYCGVHVMTQRVAAATTITHTTDAQSDAKPQDRDTITDTAIRLPSRRERLA